MNETARTLCHEWSKAKKAAYNRDYYQKHKEYWRALAESNKRMDSSFGETSRIRNSLKKSGKQMSTADAYQYWKKHKENHDAYKDSSTLREADDIMRRGYDKNAEQEQLKKMRQYGYSVRKTGTPNASEVQEYYKAKQKFNAAKNDRKTIERANKIVNSRSKTSAKAANASDSANAGREALRRMSLWMNI